MKKIIFVIFFLLFANISQAFEVPPFPSSPCIKYDPITGKSSLFGSLWLPSPGDPGNTYFYLKTRYYDYSTSTWVKTKTYLYIQNPVTLAWIGPMPRRH